MSEQKEQKKTFDIALLIDDKEQYRGILCGPLIFEYNSRNFHFQTWQKYVKGDVTKVNEAASFVQEIDTEKYINDFLNKDSESVSSLDRFQNIVKLQLFIFKNEEIWAKHLRSQNNIHSDVVVIVNTQNKPILVLHDAVSSILNESIEFSFATPYQNGDINILDDFSVKIKTFNINKAWHIDVKSADINTFKNGICYTFKSQEAKDKLLRQSYDVALVTDTTNQIQYLLNDPIYVYKENVIEFKSCIPYKNGFYQKLKAFAEHKKAPKPIGYRAESAKTMYTFQTGFEKNKCLLFNVTQIEAWIDYMHRQTNSEYDAAIVTNADDFQVLFLNKVNVNEVDKSVLCAAVEDFVEKHQMLITKFGKLVKIQTWNELDVSNVKMNAKNTDQLKSVYFYKWDMNKQPEDNVTYLSANDTQQLKVNGRPHSKTSVVAPKRPHSKTTVTAPKQQMKKETAAKKPHRMTKGKSVKIIDSKKTKKSAKKSAKNDSQKKKFTKSVKLNDQKTSNTRASANRLGAKSKNAVTKSTRSRTVVSAPKNGKRVHSKTTAEPPKKKKKKSDKNKLKNQEKIEKESMKRKEDKRDSLIKPSALIKMKKAKSISGTNYEENDQMKTSQTGNLKTVKAPNMSKAKSCETQSAPSSHAVGIEKGLANGKANENTNDMISDENAIWDFYVEMHQLKPKTVYQIQTFAKKNNRVRSLSYQEARALFNKKSK